MTSLYDGLARKLEAHPGSSRSGGPRFDISVLLFNHRDALNELWAAADRHVRDGDSESAAALGRAVEALRPIFGDRGIQPPAR